MITLIAAYSINRYLKNQTPSTQMHQPTQLFHYFIPIIMNQSEYINNLSHYFKFKISSFIIGKSRWRIREIEEIGYSIDSGFLVPFGFCLCHRLPVCAHFLHFGPWNGTAYRRFICRFGKQNWHSCSHRKRIVNRLDALSIIIQLHININIITVIYE